MSSSGDEQQLRKSLSRASKAAERLGMSEISARRSTATAAQVRRTLGINIISLAAIVAVVWGATVFLGVPINFAGVITLFILAVAGSLATNRIGSFSFGFAAISLGLGAVIVDHVVPTGIVGLFDPVTSQLGNIPGVAALLAMPSEELLALSIGVVFLYWVVDIRVLTALYRQSGQPEAANADTVARALAKRAQNLFEDYVQVGVALGFLGFALVAILLSGIGDLGGQILGVAGEVPVLSAAVVNWFMGFVALGGTVPFLTDIPVLGPLFEVILDSIGVMGAVGFGLLAGAIIVLAWWTRRNQ